MAPKKFHDFLAVKFWSFVEAAEYTSRLREKCHDPERRCVEVIHKGAKGARPPHIVRRGDALNPLYPMFARPGCGRVRSVVLAP